MNRLLVKNILFSISANGLNLLISTVLIFIVPKNIGVVEYGFWQMYLLYGSYVSFFHLGFPDGVYLRYGGKDYSSLDENVFKKINTLFLFFQLMISILLILFSLFIFDNKIIAIAFSVSVFILNIRTNNIYILQATNRVKESSIILILANIIFIFLFIILIFIGFSWERLILIDLVSKFLSLIYSFTKVENLYGSTSTKIKKEIIFFEIKENILSGGAILIAYILGLLILGVSRWLVDYQWGVEIFAQISLAISVSNIALVFINAIGIVMFPLLKTITEEKYQMIYVNSRYWLTFFLFLLSAFFFLFKPLLEFWLPQYSFGITYLYFLFPICIFESNNSLLNLTFLKALRKERFIMYLNFFTAIFSGIIAYFSAIIFNNLNMVVFSMLLGIMFRSILGEIYLSIKLETKYMVNITREVIGTLAFIFVSHFENIFLSIVIFLLVILFLFLPDIKKYKIIR